MAFTWTPVSAGTIAKATHVNEVKTNTDALAAQLSIANYGWTKLPVSIGDKMEASQMTELQDALDYIDTNNICSAENVGFNSGALATNDSSVESGANISYDSGVESGRDISDDGTAVGTNRIVVNTSVQTSDYNPYYTTRDSYEDLTDHGVKSLP